MSRQVEFLKFLKNKNGDIQSISVTKKLNKLGLKNEQVIYDFLDDLRLKNYIEWEDNRPRVFPEDDSRIFWRGSPKKDAPFDFTAKLLITGSEYLDERGIKAGANKVAIVSAFIAVLSLMFAIYQYSMSQEKEAENKQLRQNNAQIANQNKKLKIQVDQANKSIKALKGIIESKRKETTLPNGLRK